MVSPNFQTFRPSETSWRWGRIPIYESRCLKRCDGSSTTNDVEPFGGGPCAVETLPQRRFFGVRPARGGDSHLDDLTLGHPYPSTKSIIYSRRGMVHRGVMHWSLVGMSVCCKVRAVGASVYLSNFSLGAHAGSSRTSCRTPSWWCRHFAGAR